MSFYPTLQRAYGYLSMLGLKVIIISKMSPRPLGEDITDGLSVFIGPELIMRQQENEPGYLSTKRHYPYIHVHRCYVFKI